MFTKKAVKTFPLLILALALAACGQISVGVVTNGEETEQVEVTALPDPTDTPEPSTPTAGEQPQVIEGAIPTFAYVGIDSNMWILEAGSAEPRQLTFDGNPMGNTETSVEYSFLRLSYDGAYLAYRRDVGVPMESGYDVTTGMWVMDLQTGEQDQVINTYPAGMAWKPGTHLLAYGVAVETEYFLSRGEPNPELANGIYGIDLDNGLTVELVAPERGYALSQPQWSPDGRYLAFAEILGMEGSGLFAYYDFATQMYLAWEEAIGFFSWSPNGGVVAYARQVYVATGDERLYLRGLGAVEEPVGPEYEGLAYATLPAFSPDGGRIAYLAFLEGPDVNVATLMVLDLASGEVQSFGQFEGAWELAWVPDGSRVVFQSGPWGAGQIVAVDLADGTATVLAEGSQLALAGR